MLSQLSKQFIVGEEASEEQEEESPERDSRDAAAGRVHILLRVWSRDSTWAVGIYRVTVT
jgi:hypothetical protein